MDDVTRSVRKVNPDDINPRFNWGRHLPALGTMGVDFEERVDYRRLHKYRIGRVRQALDNSELGALITFDLNNIRYITSTKIGEWERGKLSRWALLARGGEPILWDFGSAAVHHKLFCPWLEPENMRAGLVGLRGTVHPNFGAHGKARQGNLRSAQGGRRGEDAERHRHHRAAYDVPVAEAGPEDRRWPADHAGSARDQERG